MARKCAQMLSDQFQWDTSRSAQDNLSQLLQNENVIIIYKLIIYKIITGNKENGLVLIDRLLVQVRDCKR